MAAEVAAGTEPVVDREKWLAQADLCLELEERWACGWLVQVQVNTGDLRSSYDFFFKMLFIFSLERQVDSEKEMQNKKRSSMHWFIL